MPTERRSVGPGAGQPLPGDRRRCRDRQLASALGKARLVVVGAEPVELRPFFGYGRTKNMNAMFVYALARRLAGTAVTVNGAHPGIITGTGLSREVPGLGALVRRAFRAGLLPPTGPQPGGGPELGWAQEAGGQLGPETGADTPAWLATSPEVEGITGRFYVDRRPVQTAPHTTDTQRCDRLWEESARLVGLPA